MAIKLKAMTNEETELNEIVKVIAASDKPLSLFEIREKTGLSTDERTLRRRIGKVIRSNTIERSGKARAIAYSKSYCTT